MKTFAAFSLVTLLSTGFAYPTSSSVELDDAKRDVVPAHLMDEVKRSEDDLHKRLEFNANLAFGAGFISTGVFAYNAAGTCPVLAKDEDVNKAQCGISATFGLFTAFFTGYQAVGLAYNRGPTTNGRMIKREGLPYEDESLVSGFRTSMDYSGLIPDEDDGEHWHHYTISNHHIASGITHNATLRYHPHEDRQHIFTRIPVEDDSLGKRQTFPVATYAWKSEAQDIYDQTNKDEASIRRITLQAWNYSHDNNIAQFCANMATDEAGPREWNRGNFALAPGAFNDYSDQC